MYTHMYVYMYGYMYMITDVTKKIWETIDELVVSESIIESCYSKLQQLGFPKKEVNDIIECFVVDKLNKIMEEK